MKLHYQMFMAITLAALCGALTHEHSTLLGISVVGFYTFIGTLFINALKMLVIPLIVSAIISALAQLGADQHIGRLGLKTFAFYLLTGLLATTTGLICINVFAPGLVSDTAQQSLLGLSTQDNTFIHELQHHELSDFAAVFLQLFPPNLVEAALNNQMLGLISFSLLFGYFLSQASTPAANTLKHSIQGIYEVMIQVTLWVIRFAPIGVFGLIAAIIAKTGFATLKPMLWFMFSVLCALLIHAVISLGILIHVVARRSWWQLLKAMAPALLTAFSTASSAAALPVTLQSLEHRARVSPRVTNFVLPLGSSVNMDGTGLYECAAVLFIAQIYGIELSISSQILIVLTALLTSVGVAGIPAASLVAITLILGMLGIPAEAIGLLMITDRLLDMCRTTVNVWGDCVVSVLIARSEGEETVLCTNQIEKNL